jgi:hypothetical protein
MKSLVTTALLRGLLQALVDQPDMPIEVAKAYAALSAEDAIFMLDESYEIAKVFNTPTHQVVMLKEFEEERVQKEFDPNDEEDFGEDGPVDSFSVEYSTSYQITQIMFHRGVRIRRSFGYQEEADRDEYWAKVGQQQAQEFVDATVKFIESNSDEDSDQ